MLVISVSRTSLGLGLLVLDHAPDLARKFCGESYLCSLLDAQPLVSNYYATGLWLSPESARSTEAAIQLVRLYHLPSLGAVTALSCIGNKLKNRRSRGFAAPDITETLLLWSVRGGRPGLPSHICRKRPIVTRGVSPTRIPQRLCTCILPLGPVPALCSLLCALHELLQSFGQPSN